MGAGASTGDDARVVFVIDVSNIVHWRSRGERPVARLSDLDLVTAELKRKWPGCVIRALADASLIHRIRETDPSELGRYQRMLETGEVLATPAGTKADVFVIQEADAFGGYMVTNDLYNKEGERDLAPDTVVAERFVRVHFAGDAVMLDTKGELTPLPARAAVPNRAARSVIELPRPAAPHAPIPRPSAPAPAWRAPSAGSRPSWRFVTQAPARTGGSRTADQGLARLALIAIAAVLVAAVFGSAGQWAIGIVVLVAAVAAVIAFFNRFGASMLLGALYAGTAWAAILSLVWARELEGFGGGLLLLIGLGIAYVLGMIVMQVVKSRTISVDTVAFTLLSFLLAWSILSPGALPSGRSASQEPQAAVVAAADDAAAKPQTADSEDQGSNALRVVMKPPKNMEGVSAPVSGQAGWFQPVHTYDLGRTRKIARIAITWTPGNPNGQGGTAPTEFQSSVDASTWKTFGKATGTPHEAKTVSFEAVGRARYIRIFCPTKFVDDSSIEVTFEQPK